MTDVPILPQSRSAEEALIGSILIDPASFDVASQFLTGSDFYIVKHRWTWEAFEQLRMTGTALDYLTTCKELDHAGRLQEAGGPAWLTGLVNQSPTSIHAEAYAREVKECAIRRELLATANRLAMSAYDMQAPIDMTLADTGHDLERLQSHSTGHEVDTLAPVLTAVCDELAVRAANPCDIWGIPIGLPKLDNETGGQQPGELTLLAGEPGLGKTWFAIGAALEMATHEPGAFFTLEMGKEAITRRILAATSGIRSHALRSGRVDDNDWVKIGKAVQELESLPFYLDDRSRDTGGLRASLARLKRNGGIKWFVLDYLMLLEDYGNSETEKTGNISRALKHICIDLDLAGFVIHSVTKAGMDKVGMEAANKSNLRGSGQVIYDADLVLYLTEFEPDSSRVFYTDEEKKRLATLWVKKGRELEDPRIRVHLTRRNGGPLWAEVAK